MSFRHLQEGPAQIVTGVSSTAAYQSEQDDLARSRRRSNVVSMQCALLPAASFLITFSNLAVWGHTFKLFGPGICPNRSETAVGFTVTHFQAEPSILDPFRTIFDGFGRT